MVFGSHKEVTGLLDQLVHEFSYHSTEVGKNKADDAIKKNMLEWELQLRYNLWIRLREVVDYQEKCVVLIASDKGFGPMLDYMKSEGHKIAIMCPDIRITLREKADIHISWDGGNTTKVYPISYVTTFTDLFVVPLII